MAGKKISELTSGVGIQVEGVDYFPYVDNSARLTKRLSFAQLVLVPALTEKFAPIASPAFTGSATFQGNVSLNGAAGARTLEIHTNGSGNPRLNLVADGSDGSLLYQDRTNGGFAIDVGASIGVLRAYGDASAKILGVMGINGAAPSSTVALNVKSNSHALNSVSTSGTSEQIVELTNVGNGSIFATENSAGNNVFSGSTPYATLIGSVNNYPFEFYTNGAKALTLDTSQNANFTNSVRVGGASASNLGSHTTLAVSNSVTGGTGSVGSSVNSGAGAFDTNISINQTIGGGTLLLLASRHTSDGTSTESAVYIVRFYYDGNNAPTTTYLGGSSDFIAFGVSGSNTLTLTNSGGGQVNYSWFGNK